MICELLFPSSILAVKMNRKTLVVVLENEIYIYDMSNMRLMHVIETTSNPEGASCVHSDMKDPYSLSAVCALSPFADASYLAYPSPVPSPTIPLSQQPAPAQPSSSSQQSGDVILFSTKSLTVANVIQAHKSPISFLSINSPSVVQAPLTLMFLGISVDSSYVKSCMNLTTSDTLVSPPLCPIV